MLKYNWEGCAKLVRMVEKHGLKLQVVMSFHQCGGNVVDSCSIPLPPWVLEEISKNRTSSTPIGQGRGTSSTFPWVVTSDQLSGEEHRFRFYTDYTRSFRERFRDYLGRVIVEIQGGLGPRGELRYPESNGTWKFPEIGEFQCYDKYMRASLEAASEAIGKHDWGKAGPHDSGHYKQFPKETGFFRKDGAWKYRTPSTDSSSWSGTWELEKLPENGDRILIAAKATFRGTETKLSGKIAGIHWHYRTRSHAAELTAGYYNTRYQDGYLPIAQMFSKHGIMFIFTCMEMKDGEQPKYANCSPEGLVRQVKMATKTAQVELTVENALERYDAGGYAQVLE